MFQARSASTFLILVALAHSPMAQGAHGLGNEKRADSRRPIGVAQCPWSLEEEWHASDENPRGTFGETVAFDGITAVVGDQGHDEEGATDAGAAYVFVRRGTTWTEEQQLLPALPRWFGRFGSAVAISGNTIVVGADNTGSGRVYVFVRQEGRWTLTQAFSESNPANTDGFGSALAIHGSILVVGAKFSGPSLQGSAFVFVEVDGVWTRSARLVPDNQMTQTTFGSSVALFEDTALIGSPGARVGAVALGAAYVFERQGTAWLEIQRLVPPGTVASSLSGTSVALDGDTAVVGSPGNGAGTATVFRHDGSSWSPEQRLTSLVVTAGDRFGHSTALRGDTIVVGAPEVDGGDGATFAFGREGTLWTEQQRLLPGDPSTVARFGSACAMANGLLVVGGEGDNVANGLPGTAHLFRLLGASVSFRNAGSNPPSYVAASPRLGSMWVGSVDLTLSGHSQAQILGFASAANQVLAGGQVLLVGGAPLFRLPPQAGPLASWTVALPADCSLAGSMVYTQALHFLGVVPFALSNAQDLVLGF